ncbi:basic-leucine zipper transcription factor A-like isoform X2 [Tribolium madens]|uniref:basic-leucine zipper transcription factor A-like isoform X2 n=1 Tax=Tribolium madens TaxID=41895 RepID=UPI001CF722A7|nr:basic-leucine zipper transcription factor A-like isoform X2 [Tribolium madens]
MRLQVSWLPLLLCGAVFLSFSEARRIRVQPIPEPEEQETIQYYAAEPQDEEVQSPRQRVVLVSSADQYNGLYGQPTASSRSTSDNYIPPSRKALPTARAKEAAKAPPVQTIRNYNKVNDDGSFTFGYEAADGSFKEETRGTDCVVRGKYGYIDPDGNKREFTYVSGNPCDPNAPKDEQETEQEQENEADNGPANYPTRPIRPIRPVTLAPKPAVTLFQNNYDQSEEEQPEPEQVLKPQQPIRRPNYITRPTYATEAAQVYQRPQLISATTPASYLAKQQSISITPRPVSPTPSARTQLPATTYRPQLVQVSVTPRPSVLYTKSSTALPSRGTGNPVYSSALVFDPTSGQYNTQLYQTLPQTEGDFSLNQRIQPYVHQPQRTVVNLQQLQQQSPLYTHLRPQPSQAEYQQQQAGLQFQNSAHLYAQQQRARLQQQQQQKQAVQDQPVYYIQPSGDQPLASGQIDAFLRGHNIQF